MGGYLALTTSIDDAASSAPTFITGQVASAGTTTAGTGFTPSRSSTGVYVVTFDVAFSAVPTVIANAVTTTNTRICHVSATTTAVTITIRDDGNTVRDIAFHFVAFPTV